MICGGNSCATGSVPRGLKVFDWPIEQERGSLEELRYPRPICDRKTGGLCVFASALASQRQCRLPAFQSRRLRYASGVWIPVHFDHAFARSTRCYIRLSRFPNSGALSTRFGSSRVPSSTRFAHSTAENHSGGPIRNLTAPNHHGRKPPFVPETEAKQPCSE